MDSKTSWTNVGVWASFDCFFRRCTYGGISVHELENEVKRKFRESRRPITPNILINSNVVLVDSRTLSSARARLLKKMKKEHPFYEYSETYSLLKNQGGPHSFSISITDETIRIADMRGYGSTYISDGLMFLAEKVKLPVPRGLEEKWIQQMKEYADRDWLQASELARRDKRESGWVHETTLETLRVAGYIPYLKGLPEYSFLRDIPHRSLKIA